MFQLFAPLTKLKTEFQGSMFRESSFAFSIYVRNSSALSCPPSFNHRPALVSPFASDPHLALCQAGITKVLL